MSGRPGPRRGPRRASRPSERGEFAPLARLAAPVVLAQLGWMALGVVDALFVGRLGPNALAAVALGDLWIVGTLLAAMGVLMGLDPLVARAHGAGDGVGAARALQLGTVAALFLAIPLTLLWTQADLALRLLGQTPELAAAAQAYVSVQLWSAAPFLVFVALRQYLQGRAIMLPGLVVVVAGNVVNAVLDWLLIFGHWGFPALGVRGSGIATGVARVAMLVVLFALVRIWRLHEGAWTPWSREALRPAEVGRLLALGLPIGAQLMLEMWAFAASSLLAGWLGAAALAAHSVALKLASVSYMVPLGISIAAATRVGNLLGAGRPEQARRAAWTAVAMGAGVMTVSAVAFVVLRRGLPALFLRADAAESLPLAAGVLPIAAAFQLFDGTQAVAGGVLRGAGQTRAAALINLLGYYALALPLAYWLGFGAGPGRGLGLSGIWIGLAVGLFAVAGLLVARIKYGLRHNPSGGPADGQVAGSPGER